MIVDEAETIVDAMDTIDDDTNLIVSGTDRIVSGSPTIAWTAGTIISGSPAIVGVATTMITVGAHQILPIQHVGGMVQNHNHFHAGSDCGCDGNNRVRHGHNCVWDRSNYVCHGNNCVCDRANHFQSNDNRLNRGYDLFQARILSVADRIISASDTSSFAAPMIRSVANKIAGAVRSIAWINDPLSWQGTDREGSPD